MDRRAGIYKGRATATPWRKRFHSALRRVQWQARSAWWPSQATTIDVPSGAAAWEGRRAAIGHGIGSIRKEEKR